MDIIIEKHVQVPMRDEALLAADIYRPADGAPAPTLVMRSPYNKEFPRILSITIDVLRAVQAGYAVVIQDCRGRYQSAGAFDPFFQEAQMASTRSPGPPASPGRTARLAPSAHRMLAQRSGWRRLRRPRHCAPWHPTSPLTSTTMAGPIRAARFSSALPCWALGSRRPRLGARCRLGRSASTT